MLIRYSRVRFLSLAALVAVLVQVPTAVADTGADAPVAVSRDDAAAVPAPAPSEPESDFITDPDWFASAEPERGIRFRLYPTDDDVYLGWRFEF